MAMLKSVFFSLAALVSLLTGCAAPTGLRHERLNVSVKSEYTVTRNIVYTPEDWPAPVMGDFYRPKSLTPVPAVLLIHGGGWTGGDGRWQMDPIAIRLAKRGYAVLNVTYRLAPRWIYPAPVDDLREAVKWIRTHAAERGMDPERIATFGYSAGGYLAALTGFGVGGEDLKIRAVVAGGAPSDLSFYPGGKLVPQFLGGTRQEIPERFREASPVNHVAPDSPPVFLYHSTADRLVKPEHAYAMVAALEEKGVPHEVHWIRGRGHIGAFLLPGRSLDAALDFLDRKMR
jgi:acetyl esterase/lipase